MKKAVLIIIVLGMVGWAVYDMTRSTNDSTVSSKSEGDVERTDEVGLSKGQMAPDFELKTLEGDTVQLSDYQGERVILNFWATWCPPCRAEIPDFKKLYGEKDVVILAVNLTDTEDNTNTVTNFVNDFEMNFPVLMDTKSEVANTYKVQAYPTSYMIDSDGHIRFTALGAMNYDFMVKELEKME